MAVPVSRGVRAGAVWYPALFPISLTMGALTIAVYWIFRAEDTWARRVGIGLATFVAGVSYIQAIALAPALLLAGILACRSQRVRMLIAVVGVCAGFAFMLVYEWLSVGIWGAYFISERPYTHGRHSLSNNLKSWLRPLWHQPLRRRGALDAVAHQSLFTLILLVVVLAAFLVAIYLKNARFGWAAPRRHTSPPSQPLQSVHGLLPTARAGGSVSTVRRRL